MPFSFLNPWFWLGALAVAAPLWLHLRRKQQSNLVRFLDDQPEPRRSPRRLHDPLLFVLRLLALLLVIAGFAWPYLRGADTVPIRESRVYILDNTLSHRAKDGFAKDRDRVVNELEKTPSAVQVAVVELTSTPRVLVSFADDRQTSRQRVQQLQPSFQRGSYLAAFRQASSLLANSLGQQKRIIFLGDNQQNQWNENINTPPFLNKVQIDLPKTPAASLPNLWLSEPRAQRIFLGDKSLVNFTVKLGHVGEARSANVLLRVNGQVIFNRAVDLENQPQSILLQAQWEAEPSGWLRGQVIVEGAPDALAADNRVFFSLLLAQSQYLRVALSPDIMRGQWATRVIEPSAISAELSAAQEADVLCVESNYLQSGDARKLLWRYLNNGRGVFLLVNRVTPGVKAYLRELGFQAGETMERGKDGAEKFQFVSFNHPVFHPFLSPDYGNLMEVKVSQYVSLQATDAIPLIFSERGGALFFQATRQQGKLFVAAFGMDREHTSWPVHQSFIPFLDLTLQAARSEDPTPTTFEPGEIIMLQLPATASSPQVVLRDERGELAHAPITQGKAQLRLPDQPGLYTLGYEESAKVEKVFSVNPPAKESELAYADATDTVKAWKMDVPLKMAGSSASLPARLSLRGILQQRLWWWMISGALLALMLETALAGTRKERG